MDASADRPPRCHLQDGVFAGGGGQRPEQRGQQPGLAAQQAAQEEGHQVVHRPAVWQEGEGASGAHGPPARHGGPARWGIGSTDKLASQIAS